MSGKTVYKTVKVRREPEATVPVQVPNIRLVHILIMAMVWVLGSIWALGGGMLHLEVSKYLPYHLSNVPLMNRLFDSNTLDNTMFQARELSYALDAIDCHFIAWSTWLGFPHFLSLTYYLCAIGTALLLWKFLTEDLELERISAGLMVLLFLTAPSVFLSASYFRSSKIALTLAWMIIVRQLYRGLQSTSTRDRHWLVLSVVCFAGTLCDRQGFFFLLVLTGLLAVRAALGRTRNSFFAFIATLSACCLAVAYNRVIAPQITHLLNGFLPDFTYQELPWTTLFADPVTYLVDGLSLLLDTLRFAFGDLPPIYAICLLAACVWALTKHYGWLCGASACGILASLAILNGLMELRHPPVVWVDIRRFYYWIPQTLLLLIVCGVAASTGWAKSKVLGVRTILILLALGNMAALPEHRAIVLNGHLKDNFAFAKRMRLALASKDVPPDIAVHPIYRALH